MKSSPRRGAGGFDVFDFKEEDELADLASEKFLEKFKSSSVDHHSTLKEEFVECGNAFLYFPTVSGNQTDFFLFVLFHGMLSLLTCFTLIILHLLFSWNKPHTICLLTFYYSN